MQNISIFTGFNKVEAVRSFAEIVDAVREGGYRKDILRLRKLLAAGKEEEYREQKRKLVAFTPSGKFEGGRKPALLTDYSGIIVLDVDKTNEKTAELKEAAIHLLYTHCCFISPGGNGLKIFVRVETGAEHHLQAFNALKGFYEKSLNVTVDPSGKDITRLCFFSFDEDAYYNEDSQIYSTKEMEKEKEPDYLQIFQAQVDFTNKIAQFHPGNRNNYIYQLACNCNRMGMPENLTNQYIRQNYDLEAAEIDRSVTSAYKHHPDEYGKNKEWKPKDEKPDEKPDEKKKRKEITANKFTITEEYLREHFTIRYNVVSNKFEYKGHEDEKYKELNENNLYVRLQKDNVNISMNNLVALLKSDFVEEYNPFLEYFKSLPEWDGQTDYIQQLCGYLKTPDRKRLDLHFKKWLVRAVKTAIDDFYYNKQALVLVSTRQNSGKSTFCRFLCPPALQDYIVENIGTDKDSLVAVTENFLINLDELSTAEKNEINAFKSMFSKDKIKARLTYDKRASIHVRRASFIGSTDRWEFLTDENGSVRWLCFDITEIDWKYSKQVDINKVYAHAWHLLTKSKFDYELTPEEISENDRINKKYQVSTPERDLIQRYFKPSDSALGIFFTATDVLEYILQYTTIKLTPEKIGKEMKFLGFERTTKRLSESNPKYGYYLHKTDENHE